MRKIALIKELSFICVFPLGQDLPQAFEHTHKLRCEVGSVIIFTLERKKQRHFFVVLYYLKHSSSVRRNLSFTR